MHAPKTPSNEAARLEALRALRVLDTPPEPTFDALTALAATILQTPIVLVSLIDVDRQWFKSRYGLDAPETPRDVSFCGHVVAAEAPLVVNDAYSDVRFADNPLVTGEPRVVFYAGMPLRTSEGFVLGTLCAIDHAPRAFSEHQTEVLRRIAAIVVERLEARRVQLEREVALREGQAALQRAESQLRALFESMSEGVVHQSNTGEITFCNAAAMNILGLTLAQLQGRTSVDPGWRSVRADGSPFPGESHPAMETLRTGQPARNVIMGIDKPDAGRAWITINAQPLFEPGNDLPTGVLTTFADITFELQARQERERSREQLARQERLVTAGTLAAGVGHEINNPLSFVTGNIDYVLDELRAIAGGSPSGRMKELAEVLVEARQGADRIRRIVRGLRAFARDEDAAGPTDLASVVESSIHMANHELRHKATVVNEVGDLPLVPCEEARLSQVFVNLLVNAAHAFTEADPTRNRVIIRARAEDGERIVAEVSDNGPGIPSDVLPRIFDPFFTTKPVGAGTGLGLAISHNIVTAAGGSLVCETEEGAGTVFRITLPIARVSEPCAQTPPTVGPKAGGRVLVVDDDAQVARSIARLLQSEHEVHVTLDPREALTRLTAGEVFHLVLCDLTMPHLAGWQLHEQVHAVRPALAERFVFITGGVLNERARDFLDAVPNERLEKPFNAHTVRALARRFATLPG